MGDLVGSERHSSVPRLAQRFDDAVAEANRATIDIASPLTITLGDEFQGLLVSLTAAARIARSVRFGLLENGIDCRFAIGVAQLETPLNPHRAWNMMGLGLAETRRRLNEKRADTLYRFNLPAHPALETMLEASGASLTAIERGWTETQRRDIALLMDGANAADVARLRNVSAHSVYKVRASGSFDLYALHWNAIAEALTAVDAASGMGPRG